MGVAALADRPKPLFPWPHQLTLTGDHFASYTPEMDGLLCNQASCLYVTAAKTNNTNSACLFCVYLSCLCIYTTICFSYIFWLLSTYVQKTKYLQWQHIIHIQWCRSTIHTIPHKTYMCILYLFFYFITHWNYSSSCISHVHSCYKPIIPKIQVPSWA